MINTLRISHFKSIRELELPCRRVNVFVGEPNTGKSNILESLALLSFTAYGGGDEANAHKFLRFEETLDFFHGRDVEGKTVEVAADDQALRLNFSGNGVEGFATDEKRRVLSGDFRSLSRQDSETGKEFKPIKFYRFEFLDRYNRTEPDFLLPPSGANLLRLLRGRERWGRVNSYFAPLGLRLRLRDSERRIEVERLDDQAAMPLPYALTSDTLLRYVFHTVAIESNRDSVLIFEEPEAHAFPVYTKQLAEFIAFDDHDNQYFLSTHNPYFLEPLVEKCPVNELAVFVVSYRGHETKAGPKPLSAKQLSELLEADPFFNLHKFAPRA